jgi:membrane protease subunit HflC
MKKIWIVAVLVAIVSFALSLFTVNEGEYACVKRFGKIIEVRSKPGIALKIPFLDEVTTLPNKQIIYDLTASDVLTADKKAMVIDNFVLWRIIDPLQFVKSVTYIAEAEKRIDAAVYNVVKNTMGTLQQNEIINEKESGRGKFDQIVKEAVAKQLEGYGISVLDVKIKRLDLPPSNENAVFSRMVSEREKIAAQYIAEGEYEASKIKNEVSKEANILVSQAKAREQELIGEGEAEFIRILADTYSGDKAEFYEFIRTLDAMKKSLKGSKTLILPIDSPITRYLSAKP